MVQIDHVDDYVSCDENFDWLKMSGKELQLFYPEILIYLDDDDDEIGWTSTTTSMIVGNIVGGVGILHIIEC